METKVCSKCKVEKPISEFARHKGYKNEVKSQCHECTNAAERVLRKVRLSDPEYKERYNKYMREWCAHNRRDNLKTPDYKPRIYKPRINRVCIILKTHSQELKNDPEHLSTEFLQELIGVKCK